MKPILSSTVGRNAEVFLNICKLFFFPGAKVLDATYGAGAFWRLASNLWIYPTYMDIHPRPGVQVVADARKMPFPNESFNGIVLDPPYRRGYNAPRKRWAGNRDMCNRYGLHTLKQEQCNWKSIMQMYSEMIAEAKRVTKKRGVVIVKGMDDCTNWFVRELEVHGVKIEDVHIVTRTAKPWMRYPVQKHARKNHSYFVVLRKRN